MFALYIFPMHLVLSAGTSNEAGGFPNVEFNPEHSVEGCVYAITEIELTMLDNCMGYPKVSKKGTFCLA